MKTLIIVSDTHGNHKGVEKLLPLIGENDYCIHLGDGARDTWEARKNFPDKIYACAGNCDFLSPLPDEGELEVERVKIMFCHGHKYGVKGGLTELAREAKKRDCDIVLYGHTHKPMITKIDGVTLINPGTMKYDIGKGGTYCYLVVDKKEYTPVIVGEPLR